jgi:hypothetical protein
VTNFYVIDYVASGEASTSRLAIVNERETIITKGINQIEIYHQHFVRRQFIAGLSQKPGLSISLLVTIGLSHVHKLILAILTYIHNQLQGAKACGARAAKS